MFSCFNLYASCLSCPEPSSTPFFPGLSLLLGAFRYPSLTFSSLSTLPAASLGIPNSSKLANAAVHVGKGALVQVRSPWWRVSGGRVPRLSVVFRNFRGFSRFWDEYAERERGKAITRFKRSETEQQQEIRQRSEVQKPTITESATSSTRNR